MVLTGPQLFQDYRPTTNIRDAGRQPVLQVPTVSPLNQILSTTHQWGLNEALSALIQTPSPNQSTHALHPPYLWPDTCCSRKKTKLSLVGVGRYRYFFSSVPGVEQGLTAVYQHGSSWPFYSQASPEQIGHVFIHFCVPTFFPAWWRCWNWAIKTTWTHWSCHAFFRPPCVWRPWRCQSSKKPCYVGDPCLLLLRCSYFTELLEITAP